MGLDNLFFGYQARCGYQELLMHFVVSCFPSVSFTLEEAATFLSGVSSCLSFIRNADLVMVPTI